MQLNNYTLVSRHNRPTILSRVGLECNFLNGGSYQDPYAISSVSVFLLSDNSSPSTVLTSANTLETSTASSVIKMNFANSATVITNSAFQTSNYTPGNTASGIFRLGTGKYAVVLDGTVSLSGNYESSTIPNKASSVGDYIDLWTVKWTSGSDWTIFINDFRLYQDTLYTLTEPLLISTNTRLLPKQVTLRSKIDLKIPVDISIQNQLPEAIKNVFKESFITSAAIEIKKFNVEDVPLDTRITVSSFAETSGIIKVTSDNVLVYTFDTNTLFTHPKVLDGTYGSLSGLYQVQAKFNILDQTIYSGYMFFNLN